AGVRGQHRAALRPRPAAQHLGPVEQVLHVERGDAHGAAAYGPATDGPGALGSAEMPERFPRTAAVVARQAELARVRAAVRDGPGILVAGEAGVGKTALVGTVTAEVTAAGGSVLWLAATEASRLTPFGAIGPL